MREREVDRVGGEPPGLVRDRDALAVERVDRARRRRRRRRRSARPSGCTEPPVGSLPAGRRPQVAVSGEMPQRAGRGLAERVHQVGGVDVLPARERREQADADVDRAVANRKDPPIPGQMVAVPVADVEVALDPGLVVERTREIAANRHAQRDTCGRGRCRAPGRSGSWRRRRRSRTGPGPPRWRPRPCRRTIAPATRPPSTSGLDRLGRRPERRAGLHRPLGDHLVELAAPHDVAVGREVGVLGPGELERDAVGDRAQPVEALELRERLGETHVVELADRPRREAVAAGLLAGEALLARRRATRWPRVASQYAAAAPDGPAPTTSDVATLGVSLDAALDGTMSCGRMRRTRWSFDRTVRPDVPLLRSSVVANATARHASAPRSMRPGRTCAQSLAW